MTQPMRPRAPRLHPAWIVAGITFITAISAAGFRSAPSVMMHPLHEEFGWSMGLIGSAVSVNLLFYGLTAPFPAAAMERFGVRAVVVAALALIAAGAVLPVWMTQPWQLIACWGVLIGLGAGVMSMSLVATVSNRWFEKRRATVSGVLAAGAATGQLIFLPILAQLTDASGWRSATVAIGALALVAIPLVLWRMRNHPADLGVNAYGVPADEPVRTPPPVSTGAARLALSSLKDAAARPAFWILAFTFAVCGATTNGLVGTHFIPAAMDHGMAGTAAASLLALVGVFDIIGTVFSGWLTDRVDPALLLTIYYAGRGLSLIVLPMLFTDDVKPSMFVFILFYGLDWVATVPPTIALCRAYFGPERGAIVFGWVFASHQIGAAIAATAAGMVRDELGTYTWAWMVGAVLCGLAAVACLGMVRRGRVPSDVTVPA